MRNRFPTSSTSIATLMASDLLREVALAAAEEAQREPEQHRGDDDHDREVAEVPPHGLVGEDRERTAAARLRQSSAAARRRSDQDVVERPLERDDDVDHRVEQVDEGPLAHPVRDL